jgi:ligand-binding sensor domain-containing protein/sensor histidine kinase YesM
MPKLFFLFAILLSLARAKAQNFVNYSLAQGLPQSQVFATLQDSRGYMWLGTQGGGLCRFDGHDFQVYTTQQGLPSNYVYAIFEDKEQRVWIGTHAGLCFIKGKNLEAIPTVENRGLQVYSLCQSPNGDIWAGTDHGLVACNPRQRIIQPVKQPGIPENTSIWALLATPQGIWMGTDIGAFRTGAKARSLNNKNGLRSNAVRAFTQTRDGRIWIATAGGGVVAYDENQGAVTTQLPNPAWTTTLGADPAGKIWIGTSNNGVAIFNPSDSTWAFVTEKQGFPHQYVRSMTCDNAGNMWVGTSGGGVAKFIEGQAFTHYGTAQGLAGSRIYALNFDTQNRLLMAVSQLGLQVLDSSGIQAFVRDSGWLSDVKSRTIMVDNFGRNWVGTEGKGLLVFDSTRMIQVPGLPNQMINKAIPGAPGEVWVATAGGIARVTYGADGSFPVQVFGKNKGLLGLIINTLHYDQRGGLWFSDQLGNIGLIQNGRLEKMFGTETGLPGAPVRCLVSSASGHLWAGTKGAGIWEANTGVDPIRFQAIHSPQKLASDNIYLLVFDRSGDLWAGSESGVDKLVLDKETLQVLDNQHFGKNEGFLGIETCQDAALCDPAGNLWFGTMNGLMKYTPTEKKANNSAPILHFEDITLFYKSLEQTRFASWVNPLGGLLPGLELPWDENHLSFEFLAVDLSHPESLRYRWKLEGSPNAQWSPLSAQSAVNFAGLQPGQYVFSVQATSDGYTFSETLQAPFVVKKPFWQYLGVQFLMLLALAGLVALIARARIRRVKKAEAAKRATLELQNHLLQLEQKALQLQMNPHFLFNALNSIQSLVSAGDVQEARNQIGHFAQLMRGILQNSRQAFISLKEESDTLQQYLKIEQFCQQNKFEYSIILPENIDPEELEIPPMLLQPFVENAVVHGISHLNWPGKITIQFNVQSGILCCQIRDNGVGREKAARLRQERKPGHQSVAISVTRDRLEALKGTLHYEALAISDLRDETGEIIGTQVEVRMPVKVNF